MVNYEQEQFTLNICELHFELVYEKCELAQYWLLYIVCYFYYLYIFLIVFCTAVIFIFSSLFASSLLFAAVTLQISPLEIRIILF